MAARGDGVLSPDAGALNEDMTDPAARLAERRAETLALVAALSKRLDGIMESSAYSTNDDEHDPEGVTVAFERAQVAGLLGQARDELAALDDAVRRLGDGRYGVCSRCGKPIGSGRLEALPATTTCINCAGRR
jgi:RNA polymerase-binding transcription factor DksA